VEGRGGADPGAPIACRAQVEAFVKAAKSGKGLAGMLGLRKSPAANPSPGSPGSAEFSVDDLLHFSSVREPMQACMGAHASMQRRTMHAPRPMPPVTRHAALCPHPTHAHIARHARATLAQEPIPTSLVKMNSEHASRAVKMFAGILKYQGETGEALDEIARLEIAQKLLHQGLKRPELKDELYMQLLKQVRAHTHTRAHTHVHTLTCTHTRAHTRAHAHVHTHTHTHTHVHTHTHALTDARQRGPRADAQGVGAVQPRGGDDAAVQGVGIEKGLGSRV
jgi:hypothetical protein